MIDIRKYTDNEELFAEAVSLRRKIHSHPEIGMDCKKTTDLICRHLEKYNIPYRRTGEAGVIADIKGTKGSSDSIVMLRADMDALNLEEKTGLAYASEIPGRMHACGHDLHTAMLLTTARILMENRNELEGSVRLLFQPAEEIGTGADYMLPFGAMDGVGLGLGIHMDPLSPVGTLKSRIGPDWAAVDRFYIKIHGSGAHGATPHKGSDAAIATASIAMNLQTMVSRECDPMKPLVVTIGKMTAGTAFNIIASEGYLEGTCRSFDEDVWQMIPGAMERIARHTAESFRCTAEVKVDRPIKPLVNSEFAYNVLKKAALKVLDDPALFGECKQEMIGEDFAVYTEHAPCVFAHLGCDGGYPLHSNYVNFNEEAMRTGIAAEVQFVLEGLDTLNRIERV